MLKMSKEEAFIWMLLLFLYIIIYHLGVIEIKIKNAFKHSFFLLFYFLDTVSLPSISTEK